MNKIDIFTSEDYENINLDYPHDYLESLIDVLQQENKQLKERIDKAIEYIENYKRKDEFLNLNEWQTRDLLEILKGDSNE